MPNNFKLTGDYYVSKAGNDANDGLTPETPLLTIQAALDKVPNNFTTSKTIVVGSGVYKQTLSKYFTTVALVTPSLILSIIGDGIVTVETTFGTQDHYFGSSNVNSFSYSFNNIEFRNARSFQVAFFGPSGAILAVRFNNCRILINIEWVTVQSSYAYFINCQFINSVHRFFTATHLAVLSYEKCIFINSSQDAFEINFDTTRNLYNQTSLLQNCYVDTTSLIRIRSTTVFTTGVPSIPATPSNFINNNIQGKIIFPWAGAVSGISTFNVPITLAQAKIDYPTYFFNSVSADPKFNNPRLLDFTLQAGSPNVTASSDYVTNIGGTEYAVPFTASSAAFTTNATSQSLEYRGNLYYAISGSAVSGSITSGPMFLQWPRTKPLTSVNWIGALEFNKTITASLAGNNNVPAYTTFTSASGLAGANPDRLKIRLRYSTQQTQPATPAEWDNGGYWPAGTYQLFEINQKPKVDYKGTGNGDPTYVETSAIGDLVPSWIQTEIILRNDYNR